MGNSTPRRFLEAPLPELAARQAATKLRNVLRINSEFSIVTGLAALAAGGPIAELLGIDQVWLVRLCGAGLLGFAVVVFAVAGNRTENLQTWSPRISVADLGWVAGTGVIIGLGWLSRSGAIVMAATAVIVLVLALAQLRGRRRLIAALGKTDATLDESPPIEIHKISRVTEGTPAALWPVISDHALYAKLALNLKAAANVTPNGPGFKRTCTDGMGRTWSETCTLWEPNHRFDVDINIDDYPYPLQLVQGSWRVDELTSDKSTVAMTFAFQPERGIYGRIFLPMMHVMFPPILKRIAKGWERVAAERGRAHIAPL